MTANAIFGTPFRRTGPPDPADLPILYEGLRWRRVVAYAIDLCCIAVVAVVLWFAFVLLTVASLGLLAPFLWFLFGLTPLLYHTLLLCGPHSATLGMRCLDLELRCWDGERPDFLQALAQTALFYLSVWATGSLILLFALFNRRKRTLHDVLTGTLVVRGRAMAWTASGR